MRARGLITARMHPEGYFEGRAAAAGDRRAALLASFLQSDVQGDLDHARALLVEIAAVLRGEASGPPRVGNAFAVDIAADGAVIRNAVLEGAAPERFTLTELRRALETWSAAIERARNTGD